MTPLSNKRFVVTSKAISVTGLCLLGFVTAFGQAIPRAPATETVAPNIPGVVAGGTKVQVIVKDGLQFTEGPIGLPDGNLIFTETNASRIRRIDKDDKLSTFLENTNGSNALAFDAKGRLISVQTTPGQTRVGVIYPKGSESVLVDGFGGKPFNRPNDIVVDRKGGVYFSDPGIVVPGAAPPAVYYVSPNGATIKIIDVVVGEEYLNGLQLSPDEKTLYVNNAAGEFLLAFDVHEDGTVRNRRNFAKYEGVTLRNGRPRSGADGLAIDYRGRIFVATTATVPIGVQVFTPQGQHLGTIPVARVQNLAFAGSDKKTLYIVGGGSAFKLQMLTHGFEGRAK